MHERHPIGIAFPDTISDMQRAIARLRSRLGRGPRQLVVGTEDGAEACAWEAMRATYQEQAARGVPEAVRGLELIEQDRWPASGQPRNR